MGRSELRQAVADGSISAGLRMEVFRHGGVEKVDALER